MSTSKEVEKLIMESNNLYIEISLVYHETSYINVNFLVRNSRVT